MCIQSSYTVQISDSYSAEGGHDHTNILICHMIYHVTYLLVQLHPFLRLNITQQHLLNIWVQIHHEDGIYIQLALLHHVTIISMCLYCYPTSSQILPSYTRIQLTGYVCLVDALKNLINQQIYLQIKDLTYCSR